MKISAFKRKRPKWPPFKFRISNFLFHSFFTSFCFSLCCHIHCFFCDSCHEAWKTESTALFLFCLFYLPDDTIIRKRNWEIDVKILSKIVTLRAITFLILFWDRFFDKLNKGMVVQNYIRKKLHKVPNNMHWGYANTYNMYNDAGSILVILSEGHSPFSKNHTYVMHQIHW